MGWRFQYIFNKGRIKKDEQVMEQAFPAGCPLTPKQPLGLTIKGSPVRGAFHHIIDRRPAFYIPLYCSVGIHLETTPSLSSIHCLATSATSSSDSLTLSMRSESCASVR